MLEFLKTQVGPGHPLHRKKLYVSALNKDVDAIKGIEAFGGS
jgi:hypothetical protein